ncbi:thioredoxin-like protein [Gaertneriomyces semiglobifer]|nr:thioredoxin-like protein [Gaertneriomyces semiglobifer]
MPLIHISSYQEFKKAIDDRNLCVVDFYATWCGPCKAVAPRYEQLSSRYPNVQFLKVDVDEQQKIAQECGVTAMPTFHLYRGGKKLDEVVGADINRVERLVAQHANGSASGFPASGGRVLGSGAPAGPPPGNEPNYTWFFIIGALLVYLWWNKESPAHTQIPKA